MDLNKLDLGLETWTRRRFIQMSAMTLSAATLADAENGPVHRTMIDVPFEKRDPRVALIGTGGRGTSLLGNLLGRRCARRGLVRHRQRKSRARCLPGRSAGQNKPELYTNGPHALRGSAGQKRRRPGPGRHALELALPRWPSPP